MSPLQCLLGLPDLIHNRRPLLPLALRHLSSQRQPSTLQVSDLQNPDNRLPDPQDSVLDDKLLRRRHDPLQLAGLFERSLVGGTLRDELEEAGDGLGVDGTEAVDGAGGVEEDDGAELLAEAGVDAEVGVVDLGVEGDLDVVGDVAVRPGEGCQRR